jgi:hypothetical protein
MMTYRLLFCQWSWKPESILRRRVSNRENFSKSTDMPFNRTSQSVIWLDTLPHCTRLKSLWIVYLMSKIQNITILWPWKDKGKESYMQVKLILRLIARLQAQTSTCLTSLSKWRCRMKRWGELTQKGARDCWSTPRSNLKTEPHDFSPHSFQQSSILKYLHWLNETTMWNAQYSSSYSSVN